MKLIIDANVFKDLIEKGGAAATTDVAKNDVSEFGPIRRCIKISLKDKLITVESISQDISSRSYLKIEDGSGIDPKEDGTVVVLAKDLIDWVSKQKSSKMSIAFKKEEVDSIEEVNDKFQLKIIGQLKLMAKDDANTGNKWALDVFKEDLMPNIQDDDTKKLIFSISAKKLFDILSGSVFAVGAENNGITDRFSFQKNQTDFYIAATDSRCCVLTKLTEDIKDFNLELDQILINAKNLIFLIKKYGENIINFYISSENKIYIVHDSLFCSISLGDISKFKAFPLVASYFSKTQYPVSFSFNKKTFLERMENIKVVNNIAAIFVVEKDKILIHGISEVGKQPAVASMAVTVNGTPSLPRYVWGIQHLINGAKSCAGDIVKISISNDNNSFKMNSIDEDNFSVYGMRINNEKYSRIELK